MSSGAATGTAAATAAPSAGGAAEAEAPTKKRGKSKLLMLLAGVVVLLAVVAGLWFTGILPRLIGIGGDKQSAQAHPADQPVADTVQPSAFVDVPELIANLNSEGRRPVFVKLKVRIELAKASDAAALQAALPRVVDLLLTYLRETRPEELRGSAGTWRLREELIARANIAVAPVRVTDVLFTEMLIQ